MMPCGAVILATNPATVVSYVVLTGAADAMSYLDLPGAPRPVLDVGLSPEYHYTDFFSVHTESGFLFTLVNRVSDGTEQLAGAGQAVHFPPDRPGVDGSVIVFGIPDNFGNAGFTFWFN